LVILVDAVEFLSNRNEERAPGLLSEAVVSTLLEVVERDGTHQPSDVEPVAKHMAITSVDFVIFRAKNEVVIHIIMEHLGAVQVRN